METAKAMIIAFAVFIVCPSIAGKVFMETAKAKTIAFAVSIQLRESKQLEANGYLVEHEIQG